MRGFSDKSVSSWFFELSESLTAGFSPAESVSMADGIPKKIGNSLSQRLEGGLSWTAAFDQHCPFLESGERSIIAAAELSGNLPAVFKELGEARKEAATFQSRIKLASLYPIVILHFCRASLSTGECGGWKDRSLPRECGHDLGPSMGIACASEHCLQVVTTVQKGTPVAFADSEIIFDQPGPCSILPYLCGLRAFGCIR